MAQLKITLVKSTIGALQKQKATVKAMGFHKLNSSVVMEDTPVTRGMIKVVSHLVKVEDAE